MNLFKNKLSAVRQDDGHSCIVRVDNGCDDKRRKRLVTATNDVMNGYSCIMALKSANAETTYRRIKLIISLIHNAC